MRAITSIFWVGVLAVLPVAHAEKSFPTSDWKDKVDPIASEDAEVGGTLRLFSGPSPESLNYYTSFTSQSGTIFGLMYETLLGGDPITLEDEPGLAKSWTISDDKKVFTFELDPNAKWSNGKQITADDVIATYNAIVDPKNMTGPWQVRMKRFTKVEKVSDSKIRFIADKVHWSLLDVAGSFYIVPKELVERKEFRKTNFDFDIVSGPYKMGEYREGRFLDIERRSDWWSANKKSNQYKYNFEKIRFRFYDTTDTAFESFRKGELDLYSVNKSAIWVSKTSSNAFIKGWITKQEVYNHSPVGFQGFALNMRRPLFKDLKVRQALYHLLDRKKMNETQMHNLYFLHRSFYEDLYSEEKPNQNTFYEFNVNKARILLAEAGWVVNPENGKLEKNGQPFVINFLARSADANRFLSIYSEDLKRVGIDMKVELKDWAAWLKEMNSFNYDMTWAAWGAGIKKDPEPMWHSKFVDQPSSNNITGFSSADVDELIESQKTIFNLQERHEIARKVDNLVYEQVPYLLLWNLNYARLLYWNKMGTPYTVLSKFGGADSSAITYWWIDEDAADELNEARKEDKAVPRAEAKIYFDEEFE